MPGCYMAPIVPDDRWRIQGVWCARLYVAPIVPDDRMENTRSVVCQAVCGSYSSR